MKPYLFFAPAAEHTRLGHPESEQRLVGLLPFLEAHGVLGGMTLGQARPIGVRQLTRVHALGMVEWVRQVSGQGGGLLDADTYTTAESYDLALAAAGHACAALDAVLSGDTRRALVLARPPGHHATRYRPGGFCLFNNIAVAARHAQAAYGVQRIFVVDYDVHHGNGTQDIFYEDPGVFFTSVHLYHPFFYPGTGGLDEIGRGNGRGTTLNVPFPRHVGDEGYRRAFEEVVLPAARAFAPELILVSVGFDAHWQDPLASAGLSLVGYAELSRLLLELAEELTDGKIVFILEGGYLLPALHHGILNLCRALLGSAEVDDPLGPMPGREEKVDDLLSRLRRLHLRS
ncbi:MAG: histone deacetylase [Anaerolineae bacterium]|nr:histone deacetylase [Anaerolineae bacterium]